MTHPASARNLQTNPANPERTEQMHCQRRGHRVGMGKVITIQFRRSRLPPRLLNDGWWLESKAARPSVIVFPRRHIPDPKPGIRHLTLVRPEK